MGRLVCGMSYSISKNCHHYKQEDIFDCTVEGNKCIMTGNEVPKIADGHFKSLEEYKMILKNIINKEGKSMDYYSGYVTCLDEHHILNIDDALELLKYAADVYFKKMGYK